MLIYNTLPEVHSNIRLTSNYYSLLIVILQYFSEDFFGVFQLLRKKIATQPRTIILTPVEIRLTTIDSEVV